MIGKVLALSGEQMDYVLEKLKEVAYDKNITEKNRIKTMLMMIEGLADLLNGRNRKEGE